MKPIKIAIVGMGNCASSLIQGIHYYRDKTAGEAIGLMHWDIGGFTPGDIEVVVAFDVDKRKVGYDVHAAIFAKPNCTTVFCGDIPPSGVMVRMGRILDGIADHMADYADDATFIVADASEPDEAEVVAAIRESGAEILANYLPVGSEQAVRFYAGCALKAGVAYINNMPVFIASNPEWAKKFADNNIPIIGDDIKSQLGATITHRMLTALFRKRCAKLALDRGIGGTLEAPSAYFCKHPPRQFTDDDVLTLAVDSWLDNPLIDLDDVTRVRVEQRNIAAIGKGLKDFNAYDTAIFLCTPNLFEALGQACHETGDTGLSSGVERLAAAGKARTFDIGGRFWIDVDDPVAFWRAENALLARFQQQQEDVPA